MIGTEIVARCCLYLNWALFRHFFLHNLTNDLRQLQNSVVLIRCIEDLTSDELVGQFKHQLIELRNILDVNVWPFLRSTEDRDDTPVYSMVRKNIDAQIKTRPW